MENFEKAGDWQMTFALSAQLGHDRGQRSQLARKMAGEQLHVVAHTLSNDLHLSISEVSEKLLSSCNCSPPICRGMYTCTLYVALEVEVIICWPHPPGCGRSHGNATGGRIVGRSSENSKFHLS